MLAKSFYTWLKIYKIVCNMEEWKEVVLIFICHLECLLNSFMTKVPIIQKPVHWFAEQINDLVSIWLGPSPWKSSKHFRIRLMTLSSPIIRFKTISIPSGTDFTITTLLTHLFSMHLLEKGCIWYKWVKDLLGTFKINAFLAILSKNWGKCKPRHEIGQFWKRCIMPNMFKANN